MPRISVQPLVENSISHGFGQKKERGYIEIQAKKEGEDLLISVCDNGEGADLEKMKRLLTSTQDCQEGQVSSIGIRNVQQRIRLSFGESSGLQVEKLAQGGIRIDLRMPFKMAQPPGGESHYEDYYH